MFRKACMAVLLLSLLAQSLHAKAPIHKFREIVAFGDSLSDSGNALARTSSDPAFFPDPPPFYPPLFGDAPLYFEGRSTNGPNWVDQFADSLGLERPDASALGGTNYAFSGAKSGNGTNTRFPSPTFPWNPPLQVDRVGLQIQSFLADNRRFHPHDLVTLWVGANDLRDVTGPHDVTAIVDNIEAHIRTIAANGGRTIVVPNQLDATVAPFFQLPTAPDPALIKAVIMLLNAQLEQRVQQLESDRALKHTRIIYVDMFSLTDDLVNDPRFSNSTDPALDWLNGTLAPNPDNYAFWDLIHPTTIAHGILADEILLSLRAAAGKK